MKYTERQKAYIASLGSSLFKCNLGHDFCPDITHYAFNRDIKVKQDNLYNLHKFTPATFKHETILGVNIVEVQGQQVYESRTARQLKLAKLNWSDQSRLDKLIERQNEQSILHHNYNERLYNSTYDAYIMRSPVYSIVDYVIDHIGNKAYVIIKLTSNGAQFGIRIDTALSNIPVSVKRKFIRSKAINQTLATQIDNIINHAIKSYFHWKSNNHPVDRELK